MTTKQLLENFLNQFGFRDKMFLDSGPLAMAIYNTENPRAAPIIRFEATAHGGWVATTGKCTPVVGYGEASKQDVVRGIENFAEFYGLQVILEQPEV